MQILPYLKLTNETRENFAKRTGLTRMGLYNLIKGKCRPSIATVQKIEAATGGKVCYKDLAK